MAGLIDVGILKPELADYGRMEQQRNLLAQQKQQAELGQLKLEQLKQDRAMLNDLQVKLQAAGKSTDPNQFFSALIQSGNPDYMAKGYDGIERYKALQRADALLRKEAPELFGPAPGAAAPAAAPSAAPAQSMMRMQPPAAAAAPVNALGSGTFDPNAAPVNALAPQAAPATVPTAASGDRARELRNKVLLYSSSGDPRLKAMADVYKAELQELTKPQTLAPGQQLYAGGKVIYTAPEKNSEFENLLAKSGLSEAEKTALRIARAKKEATHAPGTTVQLPPQEKAEQGDRGKLLVKQYEGISETARIGARTLPSLESNAAILDKGFDTGFGTEAKAAGAKVLGALGVKDAQNYATSAQTFLGNASSAILQKQLEQKGPQTESDAQRITQTGAQLGNTKEANKFFIDVAKEQIKRDVDQRNFYDKWWEQKKTYDGAENAWYSGEGGKSLFERPGLKKYISPTSAASQIPGQGPAAPAARNTAPAANVVTNPQFPGFSIGKP
jgi:guanylate kinase